ncbi:energy transducer TonB [Pinibacter soli]|uniref:Energy transducer TonB n=1 Tax=Pinibacter soli TaxID=3044211 RepID=A0ABT6R9W6_9BACT|nr:energy transducer TonB [Pinibacter soli]MDI3319288.1 energy transducer TonB [Pinibacter soli]
MKSQTLLFALLVLTSAKVFASDTLYFRLSNPWNTVKDPKGIYLRKCVKENDYFHVWDYNNKNVLVTESFYSDTNFTKKLFCHKYYDEEKKYLSQTRCYDGGRLHGYFVSYNEKGDTTDYDIYEHGDVIKSWSLHPEEEERLNAEFARNEVAAQFPGGEKAWYKYLGDNLKIPKELENQNIKGVVILKFTIAPTGKIEAVEIIKSLNPLLDEEAVRVVRKSPKWKPAKQNGKKVQTTITQPITFG